MNRYWFAAAEGLQWLVLAAGLAALVVRRRRAPRATGLALPLVVLLTASAAYFPCRLLVMWREPSWAVMVVSWGRTAVMFAAWVVLPVAIMADRRRGSRDDA